MLEAMGAARGALPVGALLRQQPIGSPRYAAALAPPAGSSEPGGGRDGPDAPAGSSASHDGDDQEAG